MPGPWCRKCRYDLAGVAPGPGAAARCPECGRSFDPADPATTIARLVPWWRTRTALRVARSGAVVIAFAVAFWFNWLPRPATSGWRLWEWRGAAYGTVFDTLSGRRVSYRLWDDAPVRVTGHRDGGGPAYVVSRTGDGAWRIEIHDAEVAFDEIDAALSRLGDFAPDTVYLIAAPGAATSLPEVPVALDGEATAIAEGLLAAYRLEPAVYLHRFDEDRMLLRVADASTPFENVMDLFNAVRDRRFGVITEIVPATVVPRAFAVEGTEADVFWTAVLAYGRTVDKPSLVPAMSDGWHPTGDPEPSYQEAPRRRAAAPVRIGR